VDTSDGRAVQIPSGTFDKDFVRRSEGHLARTAPKPLSGTPVAATEHPPPGQDMPPWAAQPLSEIAQLGTDVARVQTTLAGRPHHRFWRGAGQIIPHIYIYIERERERERYLSFVVCWGL
jgi:hypothetical protein